MKSTPKTLNSPIHIDTSLIPDHVRDTLAEDAMQMVLGILRRPGGRELIERKKAERAAKQKGP
jgi:hypothetical protein